MSQNPIKSGLKVQIEFETGSKKTRIDCYIINPDIDRLTLSFPESKGEFIPYMSEGSEVKAFIYSFTGILIIDSIIYDAPFDGKFVIEFNEKHQVIQRRKYMRSPYITDFFLQIDDNNIKTTTVDISGGGVRFITNKIIDAQKPIKAQLRLTSYDPLIKTEGIILKKNFYKNEEYVMEFTQISEDNRDKIIQKCLQIEREQLKR